MIYQTKAATLILFILLFSAVNIAQNRSIAFTFDDLPITAWIESPQTNP